MTEQEQKIVEVPMRRKDVFQTDDGRRIEVFTKIDSIPYVNKSDSVEEEAPEFLEVEDIYIGKVQVYTPMGPREVSFRIEDVSTIKEAFDKYFDFANVAVDNLKKQLEEAEAKDNKIITAPAGVLDAFDVNQEEGRIIQQP